MWFILGCGDFGATMAGQEYSSDMSGVVTDNAQPEIPTIHCSQETHAALDTEQL